MDDILIFLLGGGIPLALAALIGITAGKWMRKNIFKISEPVTSPEHVAVPRRVTVEESCPYCGHWVTQGYIPEKEPRPVFFVCGDCKRPFSTSLQITEEQKRRIETANEDCRRVEMLPNLGEIKYEVWRCVNDTYSGCVEFEPGGNIYHHYSELIKGTYYSEQRTKRQLNVSYPGITTYPGIQHLAILCLNHCQEVTSGQLSMEYTLLDRGFAWTWKNNKK